MMHLLTAQRCLKKFTPHNRGSVRVICFPHAGGSASTFRSWAGQLHPNIELFAVQYPGREERIQETFACQPQRLIDDILQALVLIQDKPCIYLGHSLGGRLALAVALQSSLPPAQLIVSGCTTPYTARHHHLLRLTRSTMVEALRESGAIHSAIYSNADLLDFYLPLIRADLHLANQLVFPMETRCSSPVLFLHGEDDRWVDQQDARDWERLACGRFQQQNFPGDHMFIYQHRKSVIDAIQRTFCMP